MIVDLHQLKEEYLDWLEDPPMEELIRRLKHMARDMGQY